ncbi:hypothetical protein [Mediterraneibacter agrestimuris]|uniref:hypothetical protein n=1 Tax=Mediterraneibacter agrestimuris TaxID=2941333 RepID=UPI002040156A|nr:hypothetical protein [Mediterraneibacter agrestimuris]
MSNILKISTPVSTGENAIRKQDPQLQEKLIKNPVNPDKVVRADSRAEYGNERGVRQEISYESNFGNFVQTLGSMSKVGDIMSKMLFSGMANLIEAGISQGTAEEIQTLLQLLEVNPDQLKVFLKNQMNGANKLKGSLFELLRGVMKEAGSVELKSGILEFLKKYNDMSSGKHIMENIKGELREIEEYMFRNDREQLRQLSMKLLPHKTGNTERNTQILKREIIPFLGKFIADTKNTGKVRDLVTLMAFNTSRYENGELDGVVQAFKRLSDFPAFRKYFTDMSREEIRDLFRSVDFDRAAGREEWSDKFLEMLRLGAEGKAGIENREDFMTLIHGMLINESVYMPVLHAMIPFILDGTPVFSEVWLNPEDSSGEDGESGKSGVKLLLKFDMKDVGFFDIFCYYEEGKVDLLLHYPENLTKQEKEIREGIAGILKKNGMEVRYLTVEQGKESIPVSAAFPQIYERRNSVNVTI